MIEEPKHSEKKVRGDMRVDRINKLHKAKSSITRKEFHKILDKASQPIKREVESDSEQ